MPTYVRMTPSSVVTSGGSATINSDGSVTVTDVSNFLMNDVFSASYETHLVYLHGAYTSTAYANIAANLSVGGVVSQTAGDYDRQYVGGEIGVGTNSARQAGVLDSAYIGNTAAYSACWFYVVRAAQADYTVFRNLTFSEDADPEIAFNYQQTCQSNIATAYDGLRISPSGSVTGTCSVFGLDY